MTDENGFKPARRAALRTGLRAGLAFTGAMAMIAATERTASADDANKVPKESVQYQEGPKDGAKCSACVNFAPPNACNIVAGAINPEGWCLAFAPKAS